MTTSFCFLLLKCEQTEQLKIKEINVPALEKRRHFVRLSEKVEKKSNDQKPDDGKEKRRVYYSMSFTVCFLIVTH